ncbi:MAG: glycosyltransferase family 2 protein [Gammaproteobacteria bacterium]
MPFRDTIERLLVRVAMAGVIPGRWFLKPPDPATLAARRGTLAIEIVSHCWRYAHLQAYQLSSLVNYPPTRATVRMTVFHTPEDLHTKAMLDFFGAIRVPGVTWNWQPLPAPELFRRSIGRNRIARSTTADWVWFTDCDIVFHRDCIDTLASELQGRRDPLCFPKLEHVTATLAESDPILMAERDRPQVVDIDTSQFSLLPNPPRAKGAYQITHGDIARQCGYCEQVSVFQRPAQRWAKTYEDSAFRWLLGVDGTGLDVPGVYRIRHVHKGRYGDSKAAARVRSNIRRAKAGITGK